MPDICFRRSEFFKKEGFRNNLELIRGEFDFMVNKYATKDSTKVTLAQESWLTEEAPTIKTWHDLHLCYCATKKKLKHSWGPRLKSYSSQVLFHTSLIADIISMVWSGLTFHWILLSTGLIAMLLSLSVRWITGRLAIRPFDNTISTVQLPFYELSLAWRSLYYRLRYLSANKSDFTSHKL